VGTNKTSGERKASNTLVTVVKYYNHYMVRSMLGPWGEGKIAESILL
jgi:hypothetical protein